MNLTSTSYLVNSENPHSPSGLRIVVLSDFHNGDPESVLSVLRNDVPDVIIIPGDVVLGYFPKGNEFVIDRCDNIIPLMKGCSTIARSYMSIGNHECLLCDEELDIIRETGVTVLDNDWVELPHTVHSGKVLIGGLTSALVLNYREFRINYNHERSAEEYVRYPYRKKPRRQNSFRTESSWLKDFESQEGYKILMSHHPEYWALREPMIKDMDIDLVISGHAHGGQCSILGHGLYAPGQGLLPAYTSGMHKGPHGTLVVSRGLSNPYRGIPRLGNPCEIVYIEIGK